MSHPLTPSAITRGVSRVLMGVYAPSLNLVEFVLLVLTIIINKGTFEA